MACFIREQNVVQGENPVKVYITNRGKTVTKYQSNVPIKHSVVNRAFSMLSPALQLSILRRKANKQAIQPIIESEPSKQVKPNTAYDKMQITGLPKVPLKKKEISGAELAQYHIALQRRDKKHIAYVESKYPELKKNISKKKS